jgi:ectoine hydroxylase-related dioxygenase (phytanoyl-CoA dioxygenase family)
MMLYRLTDPEIESFHRDGFVIKNHFLTAKEVSSLLEIALNDAAVRENSYDLNDQTGKKTKLALWFTPGDDAFGLLSRSERMVNAARDLLDGDAPVCHFHSKLMQKEPRVGGAWEWHQDYGYWYKNEFLFPDQMFSVMVALTPATRENGCLQVIRGSHKMGRVEHGFAGEQVGASQHYVDLALKTMSLVYVALEPGDALFFHSNLLHRSAANLSDSPRWSLISVYNRASNVAYNDHSTSSTVPIDTVPDDALLTAAKGTLGGNASFLSKDKDVSLK